MAVLDVDLATAPDGAVSAAGDVTDDLSVTAAVGHVSATTGGLDVLVKNAGIGAQGNVEANPLALVAPRVRRQRARRRPGHPGGAARGHPRQLREPSTTDTLRIDRLLQRAPDPPPSAPPWKRANRRDVW